MAEPNFSDRLNAIRLVTSVVKDGRSLSDLLRDKQQSLDPQQAARLQELTYGTLRWSYRLDAIVSALLKKPMRNKDTDVRVLLWIALYEILYMRTPDYAVVSSYAALTGKLRKSWSKALVNATLREFLRTQEALVQRVDSQPATRYSAPSWLLTRMQTDWPAHVEQYFEASNRKASLVLRVNSERTSRQVYRAALESVGIESRDPELGESSIELVQSVWVESLPHYEDGHFAVQDSAAQLVAELVNPAADERVLDACAAPGGKTCHLLELQPTISLTSLDNDAARLARVTENLQRQGHSATLRCADASQPEDWWDGNPFDAILLDAPCSALGVLRRHPDIRQLRRESDIDALATLQRKILDALWQTLASGGRLIYATCSVLRQENEQTVAAFLHDNADATEIALDASWGYSCPVGRQILPGQHGSDGFYYAILGKQ